MNNAALWATELNAALEAEREHTSLDPKDWHASGRASQHYPDGENWAWWLDRGPAMLDRYEAWRRGDALNPPWKLWHTPDGKPAIELGLQVPWGSTELRCFIDRVFHHPFDPDELAVVDIKSGSYTPGSSRQLGIYASAVEIEYGIRPKYGGYYMARTGTCILRPLNVPSLSIGHLVGISEKVEKAFELELFVANPSNLCSSCSVRMHCKERN